MCLFAGNGRWSVPKIIKTIGFPWVLRNAAGPHPKTFENNLFSLVFWEWPPVRPQNNLKTRPLSNRQSGRRPYKLFNCTCDPHNSQLFSYPCNDSSGHPIAQPTCLPCNHQFSRHIAQRPQVSGPQTALPRGVLKSSQSW